MDLLSRFVNRIDFDSYEDFKENFKIIVPEDFNFGFDVVDVYAKEAPDQEALIWCDDDGNERHFNFKDISEKSNRVANMFKSLGIMLLKLCLEILVKIIFFLDMDVFIAQILQCCY